MERDRDEPFRGRARLFILATIVLGFGMGGFADIIVLHQLLQWHHMVSNVEEYPTDTVDGLEANTRGDGVFDATTWVVTGIGAGLLLGLVKQGGFRWRPAWVGGGLLFGWGLFNLVDSILNHFVLGLHHVRENVDDTLPYDVGFLVLALALMAIGWPLLRPALKATAVETGPATRSDVGVRASD